MPMAIATFILSGLSSRNSISPEVLPKCLKTCSNELLSDFNRPVSNEREVPLKRVSSTPAISSRPQRSALVFDSKAMLYRPGGI